jgi:hypothetical protein
LVSCQSYGQSPGELWRCGQSAVEELGKFGGSTCVYLRLIVFNSSSCRFFCVKYTTLRKVVNSIPSHSILALILEPSLPCKIAKYTNATIMPLKCNSEEADIYIPDTYPGKMPLSARLREVGDRCCKESADLKLHCIN